MANSRLLKEAIADAKAVKETALANAKIALEEAFTPRLQSILSQKLREDATEEDGDDSYGATNEDLDSSDIGAGTEVKPKDPSGFEAHTDLKGDKFMDSVSSAGGAIGSELDDYEKVADINERRYRRRMEEDDEQPVSERRRFRKENEDGEDGAVSERRFRREGDAPAAAEDGEEQPTVAELRSRMMRRLRRDETPVAGETYEDGEEIPVSEYRKFRRDMEEDGEGEPMSEYRRFRKENEDGEDTVAERRFRREEHTEDGEPVSERRFRRKENEDGETINERRRYRREEGTSEEELDLNHIIRELENAIADEDGEPTATEDDNAQAIAERRWYRRYRRDAEGMPTAEEDPMQEDDINMIPGVPSGVPASEDGTEEDALDMSGTIAEGRGYRKGRKAKRKAYRKRKYKKNAPLTAADAAEDELSKEDNAVLAERYRRLLRRYRRNGVETPSEEELNAAEDAGLAERYRRLRRDGELPPTEDAIGEEEDQVMAERYRRLKRKDELPASEDNVPTEDDALVAERYRRLRRKGELPASEDGYAMEDDEILSERYRKLRRDGALPASEDDITAQSEENDDVMAEMYRRLLRRKKRRDDASIADEDDAIAPVSERRRSRRDDALAPTLAPAAEDDTIEIADEDEAPLNERRYRRREEAPAAPAAEDDVVDLEEILRQLREEEGAAAPASEDDEAPAAAINENRRAKRQLREAYTTINSLRKTINEVNLLNAKLLFANKLFRTFNMTNEQKVKVIETLDRTKSVREIKLVYSTLAENLRTIGGKLAKRTIAEGVASRVVSSTKPASSKGVISEGTNFANRFKKLAGIIK